MAEVHWFPPFYLLEWLHLPPEKGKIYPMLNYAICEISGKQYKVVPGTALEVSLQKEGEDIEAAVLLLSEAGKLKIGMPYLKEELTLKRVEDIKGSKSSITCEKNFLT